MRAIRTYARIVIDCACFIVPIDRQHVLGRAAEQAGGHLRVCSSPVFVDGLVAKTQFLCQCSLFLASINPPAEIVSLSVRQCRLAAFEGATLFGDCYPFTLALSQ